MVMLNSIWSKKLSYVSANRGNGPSNLRKKCAFWFFCSLFRNRYFFSVHCWIRSLATKILFPSALHFGSQRYQTDMFSLWDTIASKFGSNPVSVPHNPVSICTSVLSLLYYHWPSIQEGFLTRTYLYSILFYLDSVIVNHMWQSITDFEN